MDLAHQPRHTVGVAQLPSGMPEIELRKVAAKVLTRDVMVRPVDGALELREEVLGAVGRDAIPRVLAYGVVDRFVAGQFGRDALIRALTYMTHLRRRYNETPNPLHRRVIHAADRELPKRCVLRRS